MFEHTVVTFVQFMMIYNALYVTIVVIRNFSSAFKNMKDKCSSIGKTSAIQEMNGVSHCPGAVQTLQDGSISMHDLKSPQELHLDSNLKYRKCFQSKTHFSDYTHRNDEVWSTEGDIVDYVCVGSTIIIVLILLCVFVFYVIKDHQESE